ncbi:hypothetical protein PoB_007357100 [Plakobranchus ocellatus]|uniref:Uncharacterized protein n=1 Tax=Plakobranchus ocellatus TaxID=259542 RepID=A0AAV4DT58_9GAST|nr:hypothetical protein PoB_007357100 [Plakobranchus ocellatus]
MSAYPHLNEQSQTRPETPCLVSVFRTLIGHGKPETPCHVNVIKTLIDTGKPEIPCHVSVIRTLIGARKPEIPCHVSVIRTLIGAGRPETSCHISKRKTTIGYLGYGAKNYGALSYLDEDSDVYYSEKPKRIANRLNISSPLN